MGVGLETSYYRIDGKNALFFEVDLHEVIELREKYFEPGLNEKFIKGDLFKLDWYNELDTTLPTLLIVAGVFQYFHEKDVAEFIENVKDIFENAELIFDAANRFGNIYCSFYVKRTGNKSARMYFYIEDEFAQKVNCQLIECRGFYKDTLRMLDKKWGYIQELP
ncbi:class I SAM-dependent methyltransferase [Methanobrevibacter sp.]|uniref:class I SAM-dependent methyltransferase n=1 Tax=Methanobrevibacter sp. TaxID=66852 RepID=UPI00386DD2BC